MTFDDPPGERIGCVPIQVPIQVFRGDVKFKYLSLIAVLVLDGGGLSV